MKSIIVEEPTHGWVLDHKTSKKKSADAVIWGLIDENRQLKQEISSLKKRILEQK